MIEKKYKWLCLKPFTETHIKLYAPENNLLFSPCDKLSYSFHENKNIIDDIKQSIIEKKVNTKCNACLSVEENGLVSERQMSLKNNLTKDVEYLLQDNLTMNDVDKFYKNYVIIIMFSNRCNLACRMCDSNVSSYFNKVYGTGSNLIHNLWDSHKNEIKSYFLSQLSKMKDDNTLTVVINGGEPLMEPSFFEFLDWLDNINALHKITINTNTNFTQPIHKKFIQYISKIKKLNIALSIDSVGDNYSLVRHPSHFKIIEKNLEKLIRLNDDEWKNKVNWIIQPLIYNNNIFYFEEFLDWWEKFEKKHSINVQFNPISCHYPNFFYHGFLPNDIKKHLKEKLNRLQNHPLVKKNISSLKQWINQCINELDGTKENLEIFSEYLIKSATMDTKSKLSTLTLNSKLFDLLNEEQLILYKNALKI